MGFEGNGTNEAYGANYPKEIKTHNEMQEYDWKRIKKNSADYTMISFGKHIAEKVFINWCDGSSALNVKMKSDIKFSKLYDYIVCQKADGWLIYCQAFRSVLYLLMLCALFRSWKKQVEELDMLWLNCFGAILFYMIWEVKSDYSIPFLPLFCCLASEGMEWRKNLSSVIREHLPVKNVGIIKNAISVFIVITGIMGVLLMEKNKIHYTQEEYIIKEPVIAMNSLKRMQKIEDIGVQGKQLIQYMDIQKDFNTVKIYCKKGTGKGTYHIRFGDTEGNIVQEWDAISKKQIQNKQEKQTLQYEEGDKKGYLLLKLNHPQEKGRYYLKIYSDDGRDSIQWYYNDYAYFDYYTGDLLLGQEKQNGELAICVSYQNMQPYMPIGAYRMLECVILLYTLFCLLGYNWNVLKRKE